MMAVQAESPPPDLIREVREEMLRLITANAQALAASCTETCIQQVWTACLASIAAPQELKQLSQPPGYAYETASASAAAALGAAEASRSAALTMASYQSEVGTQNSLGEVSAGGLRRCEATRPTVVTADAIAAASMAEPEPAVSSTLPAPSAQVRSSSDCDLDSYPDPLPRLPDGLPRREARTAPPAPLAAAPAGDRHNATAEAAVSVLPEPISNKVQSLRRSSLKMLEGVAGNMKGLFRQSSDASDRASDRELSVVTPLGSASIPASPTGSSVTTPANAVLAPVPAQVAQSAPAISAVPAVGSVMPVLGTVSQPVSPASAVSQTVSPASLSAPTSPNLPTPVPTQSAQPEESVAVLQAYNKWHSSRAQHRRGLWDMDEEEDEPQQPPAEAQKAEPQSAEPQPVELQPAAPLPREPRIPEPQSAELPAAQPETVEAQVVEPQTIETAERPAEPAEPHAAVSSTHPAIPTEADPREPQFAESSHALSSEATSVQQVSRPASTIAAAGALGHVAEVAEELEALQKVVGSFVNQLGTLSQKVYGAPEEQQPSSALSLSQPHAASQAEAEWPEERRAFQEWLNSSMQQATFMLDLQDCQRSKGEHANAVS